GCTHLLQSRPLLGAHWMLPFCQSRSRVVKISKTPVRHSSSRYVRLAKPSFRLRAVRGLSRPSRVLEYPGSIEGFEQNRVVVAVASCFSRVDGLTSGGEIERAAFLVCRPVW